MSYTNRQIDTYLTLQEFTMQVSIAEVKLMTILILSKVISIPIIKDCSQDACGRGQSIEQLLSRPESYQDDRVDYPFLYKNMRNYTQVVS